MLLIVSRTQAHRLRRGMAGRAYSPNLPAITPASPIAEKAAELQETFTFLLLTTEAAVALAPPAKGKKA